MKNEKRAKQSSTPTSIKSGQDLLIWLWGVKFYSVKLNL